MTRTTSITTIIAAVIFTTTLAGAASATATFSAGEGESQAVSSATVQLAGWTGRAKVIIKRALSRRKKVRTPTAVAAVRG